jgi:hypothetical protein
LGLWPRMGLKVVPLCLLTFEWYIMRLDNTANN